MSIVQLANRATLKLISTPEVSVLWLVDIMVVSILMGW